MIGATLFVKEALHRPPAEASGEESILQDLENDVLDLHPSQPQIDIGKRARLLLVDDSRDMREYLERLLSRRYDVDSASNGHALGAGTAHEGGSCGT